MSYEHIIRCSHSNPLNALTAAHVYMSVATSSEAVNCQ